MINKDFYDELPGFVCEILENLEEKYSNEKWFRIAWEEYREHILNGDMDSMKMPMYVFKKYIEVEE